MPIKVECVIFDMDGVITDTMRYHFKAWQQIFHAQGIAVSHEDIYKREGQKGIDSVKEIFQEKGVEYHDALGKALLKDKEELFKRIFNPRFISGSRTFIKQLKSQGFRLGLVTGSARHEAFTLLSGSIWEGFDVTVCGCDVQNGKPHPEPYLRAIKGLNVSKNNAVVIENAPFGIRSAKAAGLACFALETSLPRPYLKQADRVFKSYNDMTKAISFKRP